MHGKDLQRIELSIQKVTVTLLVLVDGFQTLTRSCVAFGIKLT